MKAIPANFHDLIDDQNPVIAFLGTTMPDGSPQVTPVWFNVADPYILINSAKGRVKDQNIRASPKIALTFLDPANDYRYIMVRGSVVEITEEGAVDHIDALARKYIGQEKYPWIGVDTRVKYKIQPEKVSVQG